MVDQASGPNGQVFLVSAPRTPIATLLLERRRRDGRSGLAALCLGGGDSVAMAFERAAAA